MSKPTSYELLKDIHQVTANLEAKMDKRISGNETRLDNIETKVDTMWGKASIGVLVISVAIGTVINLGVDWIKNIGKQ